MLIEQLTLTNILSFGPEPETVTFGPLTVLIGANGSGKSNLLEVIDLLRNAPNQLMRPIREGGGFDEWLWKGADKAKDSLVIEARIAQLSQFWQSPLRYSVNIGGLISHGIITDEVIEQASAEEGLDTDTIYYQHEWNKVRIRFGADLGDINLNSIDIDRSILAQRRDPVNYREITDLANSFGRILLYREWNSGKYATLRSPQRADMPINWLEPDAGNLGLVLHRLGNDPDAKAKILSSLQEFHEGIDNFGVDIQAGHVQVFLQEGRFKIPAIRLSDGTLRYLCLLAILCHPNPPPLVCIEEPELGLHPDIIRTVAKLLREASERCQLIVTTHSEVLVDAMTDAPESVVVCEKQDGATKLRRLSADDLKPWLERYSLGQLWRRGDIGGNRW